MVIPGFPEHHLTTISPAHQNPVPDKFLNEFVPGRRMPAGMFTHEFSSQGVASSSARHKTTTPQVETGFALQETRPSENLYGRDKVAIKMPAATETFKESTCPTGGI